MRTYAANMRIIENTSHPCFWIGMLTALLTYGLFMHEFTKLRAFQSYATKQQYNIVQFTSLMLCTTVTLYFALGMLWGYLVGTAYRKYKLASQTPNPVNYGTMASKA